MMSALMNLTAYTGKSSSANTVFTVKVVNNQVTVSRVIMNRLYTVSLNTPNTVNPVLLVCKVNIKLLVQLVNLCTILNSLKTGFSLERQLRNMV